MKNRDDGLRNMLRGALGVKPPPKMPTAPTLNVKPTTAPAPVNPTARVFAKKEAP